MVVCKCFRGQSIVPRVAFKDGVNVGNLVIVNLLGDPRDGITATGVDIGRRM